MIGKYDPYGQLAALSAFTVAYEHGARGSGRTTRMIEGLQEGDIVICRNMQHQKLIHRRIAEHFNYTADPSTWPIAVIVVDPGSLMNADEAIRKRTSRSVGRRRVVFDHDWLSVYIETQVAEMGKSIASFCEHFEIKEPEKPERPTYRDGRFM